MSQVELFSAHFHSWGSGRDVRPWVSERPVKYLKERGAPKLAGLLSSSLILGLSGCSSGILDPKGSIGVQEKHLIAISTWAMLIVVIPVIFLSLYFAWKYRATNKSAEYRPSWAHSTTIEIVIWTIPTIIIAYLAYLTWVTSHSLDPYKPLESSTPPLEVQVVALDWKWLFIYPKEGVATVNQVAFPVNTPVNFEITSDSVMNAFFIPQLGGMIYAMAGMHTKLHLDAHEAGDYAGLSANFSGRGFSDMKFRALALSQSDYDAWVQKVKSSSGSALSFDSFKELAKPSEANPVQYYPTVQGDVFGQILAQYNVGGNHMGMKMGEPEAQKGMEGMKMPEAPAAASAPRG